MNQRELERWLNSWEYVLFFQNIWVWFPAPTLGGSQPPATSTPGDLKPLASAGSYTQMHRHRHSILKNNVLQVGEMVVSNHWLLFQRPWIQFLTSTQQLTPVHSSSSYTLPLLSLTGMHMVYTLSWDKTFICRIRF